MPSIEEDILDRFESRLTEVAEADRNIWATVRTALGAERLPTPDALLRMLSETGTGESEVEGASS